MEKLIKDDEAPSPEETSNRGPGDVDAVKAALEGDDDDAVKTAFEKLQTSQTKIGEALYAQSQAEGAAGAEARCWRPGRPGIGRRHRRRRGRGRRQRRKK
ncbi:hypothetical protein QJS66_18040 [Kocuria rhizophila]|nr:hypothetical protein QJS66_18040 [Kocuria rhizophila]